MFESIERVPGDAILGLIEAFKSDSNPNKVDLGVGVYRDEAGITPVMRAVKEAEKLLIENEKTKAYIGSHGDPEYGSHVLRTVFGADSQVLADNRGRHCAQTHQRHEGDRVEVEGNGRGRCRVRTIGVHDLDEDVEGAPGEIPHRAQKLL